MASGTSKVDVMINDTTVSGRGGYVKATSGDELPPGRPGLEKAVMRKVDFWLVGFYSLVYVFRVIDSANYSNAAIINLENGTGVKKQLGLSPSQWAWTLSIFSYSYMIFEPTNTLAMKVFSPSRWMFVLILGWGIAACSSAAAQDFKGMMCVRFAIGLAEAGFFPAVLYHMAFWYKPSEMPQRIAIFYSVGQLSPAVSGLLAYAIGFMDGLGGLAGWRWLFLIEGLPAIVLSVVALWLPDYPETARILTDKERDVLQDRLGGAAPTGRKGHWDFKSLKKLVRDPTFYTFSVYWICHGIGGFGVGTALPTVIYELGFTTTSKSQLMNIPPYVSAFLFLNIIGHFLHKRAIRPWTTAVAIESTIIVCYIILYTVHNAIARYVFLIVAVSCAGSAYPVIWPERIRALEGTVASGLGIGWTNAMAQFSGIAGPHVFSTVFGPTYHVSYGICLAFLCVGIASILTSWLLIWRRDGKRRADGVQAGEEAL
ncbi:MFS general substrate transporter [Hypoxylon crocopeplum]|nr:MFS general substrate transporter [Hypoxylon crocopeplum]